MMKRPIPLLLLGTILLAACAPATSAPTDSQPVLPPPTAPTTARPLETLPPLANTAAATTAPSLQPARTETAPAAIENASATPAINVRNDDDRVYAFSQLLPFDGIFPVYDPQFLPAAEVPLRDDELVMGVSWGGEAKAYSVTVMRFREIVNDELGGIPILVTW